MIDFSIPLAFVLTENYIKHCAPSHVSTSLPGPTLPCPAPCQCEYTAFSREGFTKAGVFTARLLVKACVIVKERGPRRPSGLAFGPALEQLC